MSPPPPDVEIPDDTVEQERSGTRSHALLIAIASLALAWAGFQGSEWSRVRLDGSDQVEALREESAQLQAAADRLEQQDTVLYVQWLSAVEAADQATAERLFELFRPELQNYVQAAPADEDGVPLVAPFDDPDYEAGAIRAGAEQVAADQKEAEQERTAASQNVARYGGMGVLFAVGLVVTGIATRFGDPDRRRLRFLALGLIGIGLVYMLWAPLSFSAP